MGDFKVVGNLDSDGVINHIAVTVANPGSGNKFYFDGSYIDCIHFIPGLTYRFDLSDSTTSSHPFKFSTTSDGTHNSGSEYTTGVTVSGSQGNPAAYVQIDIEQDSPTTLYTYCGSHSGMGGSIVVGKNANLLNGLDASHYLNYNNFSNTPADSIVMAIALG